MNDYKNINVAELQLLMAERTITLVDVRNEIEIMQGFIQGAEKLPLNLIPLRLSELDSSLPTVFYCRVGARSAQAATFAATQGFSETYNLKGGILAWLQEGMPLVK